MPPRGENNFLSASTMNLSRNKPAQKAAKVLVSTPDIEVLTRLSTTLANLGLVVAQASTTDEAWRILRDADPPQIALLAWELSGLDMVRYCAQEIADLGGNPIHAALLLPPDQQPELTAGLLNGARGFVHHPLVIEEVVALVDTLLKLARAENQNMQLTGQMQAHKDPVTGALVWEHFFELSDTEFRRSLRYKNPLAALMVEVNGAWKEDDGTYSHALDQAMKSVAEVLLRHLRESDILGRIGQHEFAATLPQTDLAGALDLATRLRKALAGTQVDYGQGSMNLRVNLGAAQLNESCANMGTLLLRAEGAMYQAASSGGSRVVAAD